MELVTRKSVVQTYLDEVLSAYQASGNAAGVAALDQQILSKKVKFPLLEYCGHVLYQTIPAQEQILFCDQVEALKTEGGNVILGIVLQNRLEDHFQESIAKASEYISQADVWYVCDIIGERVFGYSLLHEPDQTIPEFQRLAQHPSHWVIRSLGAGAHYAIKKGLAPQHVNTIFQLLLSLANAKNKEVRQGVGWAAKTTAKFHPDIIDQFHVEIADTKQVANWFRAKIKIGLNRNKYAQGD